MTTPNARFWIMWNGQPVKITLRPDQEITLNTGGPDEEGWSYTEETYRHDGGDIVSFWRQDAQDCDGRLTTGGEATCPLDRLHARPADPFYCDDHEKMNWPEWGELEEYRRDAVAEAAGY